MRQIKINWQIQKFGKVREATKQRMKELVHLTVICDITLTEIKINTNNCKDNANYLTLEPYDKAH